LAPTSKTAFLSVISLDVFALIRMRSTGTAFFADLHPIST